MQQTLYMEVIGSLSEKGFSLDELVVKVKQVLDQKGAPGVIELLLMLFDEALCRSVAADHADGWRPRPCCQSPWYEFHGKRERGFRTSAGRLGIFWTRLRCQRCGKTVIPLREFLGVAAYQPKTAELERVVAQTVSETSYRRSTKELALVGDIPVPKSTAHRWVMQSDCDEIRTDGKLVDVLFADGTGYKRRPDPDKGLDNKGELKVAMGIRRDGVVVPFGCWSGLSWEEVGKAIRGNTELAEVPCDEHDRPAQILMTDGERKLAEGLADLANDQARCQWHAVRQLYHPMWRQGAKQKEYQEAQGRLAGVLGIEVPAEDFKLVSEAEKEQIAQSVQKAEQGVEQLACDLAAKGYSEAASYLRNAKDKLFTHIRFWLKTGLLPTRTSSLIERMMRELGRRLKKIAFGWSERGAAKIARIILKRITSAAEWDEYWTKRLRMENNVAVVLIGPRVKS